MKKSSRGLMSYVVMIGTFLLIAILLNGSLGGPVSKRIEYPQLLQMIQNDQVGRVAIRNNTLVGLRKDTKVAATDFPDNEYDFETTIGDDFIVTVRQMEATEQGKPLDEVSVSDLGFTVEYRAPVITPWWYDFIPFIIMTVIIMLMWMFLMRAQSGGNNKVMSFGKSRARVQEPGKNKVTFADVAGADEEKEELKEMVDFLRNPKAYTELGARIPKGVLLVGPPGTGKTLLAKAVAGEAGVPFFSISGSDFVEMFVGVGASRVRDLFAEAKKSAPAIVFIDEIDAVGRHRGAGLGGGHDEREQTLNQLLVEMDGFAINEGVIVMAATNRRDILDPALLRPGRFDRQITVNYPDMEGRVAILKVHSKGKPLAADVDLRNIAKRTPYHTGADLENVMNEAAILAARSRQKEINHQLLVDALARVQMGPEKRSHKVSEHDKRLVAIHEAGHAIVDHFVEGGDEVHLVTIVPRGRAAGHTLSLPGHEDQMTTESRLRADIAGLLGGHAAEKLALGEYSVGATSDLQRATELCRRMITEFGMNSEIGHVYLGGDQEVFLGKEYGQRANYSEQLAARIDAEIKRMMADAYEQAMKLLEEHRERFEQLIEALIERDTISRKEFVALMETGEIPEGLEDEYKPRPTADIPAPEKKESETVQDKPELPDGFTVDTDDNQA